LSNGFSPNCCAKMLTPDMASAISGFFLPLPQRPHFRHFFRHSFRRSYNLLCHLFTLFTKSFEHNTSSVLSIVDPNFFRRQKRHRKYVFTSRISPISTQHIFTQELFFIEPRSKKHLPLFYFPTTTYKQ
jgi:hypothetical protein